MFLYMYSMHTVYAHCILWQKGIDEKTGRPFTEFLHPLNIQFRDSLAQEREEADRREKEKNCEN